MLPSPYDVNTIQEVVPDVARVSSKLSASSVIQERRRVRFVPSSGQRYENPTSATQINWTIQDTGYLDLQSASVSFSIDTWDSANTGNVAVDDGAYSVFRRLQLSDNSMLLEDIDRVALKANAELYAQADQSWYDSVGSMMGMWKHAATNALAGSSKYAVANKLTVAAQRTQVASTGAEVAGMKNRFSVPLSLLSDFFKEQTMFPLRNAGTVFLSITLASPLEALVCSAAGCNPQYRIKDVTLECDVINAHPTFVALLDSICQNESEDGLKFPFNATLLASQNIIGGSSGAGAQSVQFAKASQNLRSIQMVFQSQQGLSSKLYAAQSTFANPGMLNIYTRVGGTYFPSQPSIGAARQYADLMNLYGSPAAVVGQAAIADILNYYTASGLDISGNVATSSSAPYSGVIDDVNTSITTVANCDCYSWGYSFDRLKRAKLTKALDLDGINSLSQAGAVLVVEMQTELDKALTAGNGAAGFANGLVATALIKFTRILEMKNGSTKILG